VLTYCALSFPETQFIPNKQLQPKETQIYIKLVKYAMQALDIYQVREACEPDPEFGGWTGPEGLYYGRYPRFVFVYNLALLFW
jgi:hypothetical protein